MDENKRFFLSKLKIFLVYNKNLSRYGKVSDLANSALWKGLESILGQAESFRSQGVYRSLLTPDSRDKPIFEMYQIKFLLTKKNDINPQHTHNEID